MNNQPHPSIRGYFAHQVHKLMREDKRIWVITGDLGYGMWDQIREDFPDRFINTGAAEQSMLDIAVGLALEGQIPIVYSISTFLLYRGFETLRTYINHESIPVKMVGSGHSKDYEMDGISHWVDDDKKILSALENIECRWIIDKDQVERIVSEMAKKNKPFYVNLKR